MKNNNEKFNYWLKFFCVLLPTSSCLNYITPEHATTKMSSARVIACIASDHCSIKILIWQRLHKMIGFESFLRFVLCQKFSVVSLVSFLRKFSAGANNLLGGKKTHEAV